MVNEQEGKKIRLEAQEITKELCTVFEGHLTALINQDGMETVVGDVVEKTLVCKANRDNPDYPKTKEMIEKTLYISKMQAKQLLNREIQRVERVIPKQLLMEGTKSIKINVELSD